MDEGTVASMRASRLSKLVTLTISSTSDSEALLCLGANLQNNKSLQRKRAQYLRKDFVRSEKADMKVNLSEGCKASTLIERVRRAPHAGIAGCVEEAPVPGHEKR